MEEKIGRLLLIGGLILALVGCRSAPADNIPAQNTTLPTPTATAINVDSITAAYAISEPSARREAVLTATGTFLREADPDLPDEDLSAAFTTLAFSCNCLTQPMPALIDRDGGRAVISLPDGLGLFLYDLDSDSSQPVLELSRWTVGLSALEVSWGEDELTAGYGTQGSDGIMRVHALLALKDDSGWQVTWFSDEEPGWWFNAVGGQLNVAPDRSVLAVTGRAADPTEAFYETEEIYRVFRVEWQRDGEIYAVSPPMPDGAARSEWLWEVAEPSPYATLVEFIERLQGGDVGGAGKLAANPDVLSNAADFGLTLPQRRYQIVSGGETQIVFRDLQGTFVADFQPPGGDQGKWLITAIRPPGGETD